MVGIQYCWELVNKMEVAEITLDIKNKEKTKKLQLDLKVEYSIDGCHYPATETSPEEFPEVEIESISVFNGDKDEYIEYENYPLMTRLIDYHGDKIAEMIFDQIE